MVGGGGEKRTLKLAAQFADITNWFGGFEEAPAKLAVLDRHCEAIGRDPAEILRTVSVPLLLVASERDKAAVTGAAARGRRRRDGQPATVAEAAEIPAPLHGGRLRRLHLPKRHDARRRRPWRWSAS